MPSPAETRRPAEAPTEGTPPDPNPPWWPKRVAQRRSSRDPIGHDKVVETALALWREEGAEALSMRRLAAALGVAPTAIYWWAGNKDQLLAYVIDEIFGRIALPAGDAATDWRDDIRQIARHTFDTMVAYAGIQTVLHAGVPSGPHTLRHLEHWITVLLKAGFTPDEAPSLHAAFGREIMGCVAAAHGATGQEKDRWTLGFRLEDLPEDAWPGLHRAGAAMRAGTPRGDLATAVDLLIRGLDSLLAERRRRC